MKFSAVLTELRKEKQMTQKKLADLLKVSDATVRGWEKYGREPSFELLCEIAKIFNVTVGQLLGVEEY